MPASRRASPLLPLGLGVVAFAALVLLLPRRLYGDDVWFVHCLVHDYPFATHFLFLPLADVATRLGAHLGADPFLSLRLLAAAGTALGGALLLAAALRRGLAPARALAGVGLVLTAPSTVFFGTAAELHGPHLAAVAFLLWILAGFDAGSSARRALAAALAFGLVVGTHKSGALLLPGALALYGWLTRGRARTARRADALHAAAGGALAYAVKLGATYWQLGRPFSGDDSLAWYLDGLRGHLAQGYGLGDFVAFLGRDGVLASAALALAGAAALGALSRARPWRALGAALWLAPHGVFFALFDYPERGAYFVALAWVPALALVTLPHGTPPTSRARARLSLGPYVLAALTAVLRPEELDRVVGPHVAAGLALAALAWGAAFPLRAHALRIAGVLVLLQLVGSVRELRAYDRETPVLDWARGACEENAGRDGVVVVAGFQELWLLSLLREEWPAPWRGTWSFAESLPRPGPTGHAYGDPSLPPAAFAAVAREKLAAGQPLWIDSGVRRFLAQKPAASSWLDLLERRYTLVPVTRGAFHAERVEAP